VTRRDFSERGDRLRTLLVFTVLQAFLLTVNPHLLPMWSGEASAVRQALQPAGTDIQPLYFLLARLCLKLTGAGDPLKSLRLLSALFTVCATILLERLWLRKIATETHQWVLLLWAFSPAMLLFGRMAQSYSLQALLTVIAIGSLLRFKEDSSSWKRLAALAASLIALLYTDYLPGLAVWAAANTLLLAGRPAAAAANQVPRPMLWKTALLPNLIVAAAFLPGILTLASALPRWHRDPYSLTGNGFLEAALKLAAGFYSLVFGEAIPIWLLALSAIVAGPYLWILAGTARAHRQWLLPSATLALLGYAGAAYWVSYPFMGARLLFLLPLFIVTVAAGIVETGRLGTVFGVALFAAGAGGVWSYFEARDMINIAYVAPQQQIAGAIARRSVPADTVVWVDGLNMDEAVLAYYLPAGFAVRVLRSGSDAGAAWNEVEGNPGVRHVWFLRSQQDTSPGQTFEKLEKRMLDSWHYRTLYPYVPAPAAYRLVLTLVMRVAQPPRYLYQLWEFRR